MVIFSGSVISARNQVDFLNQILPRIATLLGDRKLLRFGPKKQDPRGGRTRFYAAKSRRIKAFPAREARREYVSISPLLPPQT
jgi:hypothetical protein